jgi:hypothetical protein
MTLTPGTRLGPYGILGLLGEGGTGVVCRARDQSSTRPVGARAAITQLDVITDWFAELEHRMRVK